MNTFIIIWLSVLTIAFVINAISTREDIKGLSDVGAEMYGWYQDVMQKFGHIIKTHKDAFKS